jgi:thymidylate synthase (FAD)
VGKLVAPKVFLVGQTVIDQSGLEAYLQESGNIAFLESVKTAREQGVSDGEILCSMMAKLCYASLTLGHNDNITRIRDIPDNIRATLAAGHGSVFEHVQLNFVVTNCSRVFTHELVRHRVGTAFSQTSGRYVRGDSVDVVFDPILEPVRYRVSRVQAFLEEEYAAMVEEMGLNDPTMPFDRKKKITSALRRLLPNGQSNEIGFSVNLRGLRHLVMLRTSRGAEWEIREVFGQIYRLVKDRYPAIFADAVEQEADGLLEVTGMKMQPY